MKKILFVMHTLGFGGAERSLVNLLNELPENKYEVDLLLFQKKGGLLEQLPQWVNVLDTPYELNCLYGALQNSGILGVTKFLGTLCSRIMRKTRKAQTAYRWKHFYMHKIKMLPKQYDVAVAYGGAELLYMIRDKVLADKKLVWIHNDYKTGQYSEVDDRPYFADMEAIVSVSDECVNVLKDIFPEYQHRMQCIENITSSTLIKKKADEYIPQEYQSCPYNILSVGRLWSQKGFDMAIEAAAILKKAGLTFRWFVIGEGDLRKQLEKQISDNALEEDFIFLGTRKNPYPYIKNCSVLVQSSRYEGKSVVLDEAKILAAPIVATAYPTVKDQIQDGKEGLITEMTPQGIANGILTIIENSKLDAEIRNYLKFHDYGNRSEVKKYMKLLDE